MVLCYDIPMQSNSDWRLGLRNERERLVQERDGLNQRIAAMDLLLDGPPVKLGPAGWAPSDEAGSVRDAIRAALRGDELSAKETIERVIAVGYTTDGVTPLKTRVYNELSRMKRDGLVERLPGKKYRMVS